MSNRNENRPGYKKTKVGWIPEEWECVRIRDVAKVITGSTPSTKRPEYYGSKFLFVGPADLDNGKYVVDSAKKLSKDGFNVCRKIPCGSTLFTCIGSTIGKVAMAGKELATNQQINAVISRNKDTKEFLYYALLKLSPRIKSLASEQAVPIVNKSEFSAYKIPLPPLPEQKKIAEILSAWDRAIEQVGKLIDAKERLKKGLMQQLLSGKIRFPEFAGSEKLKVKNEKVGKGEVPEGWKACKLGDCFKERKETNPDLPLLAITSDRGVIPRDEVERKDTSNADKSKYKRIAPGDIGYNTMRMWQGVSAVSTLEGIVSPAYTICTPKKGHSPSFFGYLFKYPPMIHLFHRFSQGLVSDTLNLKFRHFSQVKANVPSEAEQIRIATVLSTCDREIELLKKKQEKLKEQKKGLMQKLITGEVRHPDFWEYSDIPGDSINDNQ